MNVPDPEQIEEYLPMNEGVPRFEEWTEHEFESLYGSDDPTPTPVAHGECRGPFGVGTPGGYGGYCSPMATIIHLPTGLKVPVPNWPSRPAARELVERLIDAGFPDVCGIDDIQDRESEWVEVIEDWHEEMSGGEAA